MSKDELIKKITPHKMGCIGICFLKEKYDKVPVRQHILDSLNKGRFKLKVSHIINYKSFQNSLKYEICTLQLKHKIQMVN